MKAHPKRKKLLIALAVLVALAGVTAGVIVLVRRNTGKVDVYPVSDLITSADWMTDTQIEGVVTTDENQSVYVSSTEQVTEIFVEEGQSVSAGDPILAFDTTLTDLELERQRIKIEQLKLDIKDAEEELRIIGTLKATSSNNNNNNNNNSTTTPSTPSTPSTPTPTPGISSPEPLPPEELIPVPSMPYEQEPRAMGTRADPFVYLWNDECSFSQRFFRKLAATAAERQGNPGKGPEDEGEEDEGGEEDPDGSEDIPVPEEPGAENVHVVYIIFEQRESDALNGHLLLVWEMELALTDSGEWSFRLIEPAYSDTERWDKESDEDEIRESFGASIDPNGSYTAAEITAFRQNCTKRLKDLNHDLKMAELSYESLEYEFSNGEVISKLDGVVTTLIDADVARLEGKPMVVISGGGGYYVSAALGEMDLTTLAVGDSVTVQSWENYGEMEGYITEISEYPDESGQFWYYSNGNRNVSLYPFKVYVDASAGLREGEYVTVSPVEKADSSDTIFLDRSFVRQENGQSYVYAVGEDERLEQRYVKTGRNLWGSFVEILSGLSEEESIAFPYGRKTRDGAKVRHADLWELYSGAYY